MGDSRKVLKFIKKSELAAVQILNEFRRMKSIAALIGNSQVIIGVLSWKGITP